MLTPAGALPRRSGLLEAALAWGVARVIVFLGYAGADAVASVIGLRNLGHLDEKLLTYDGRWYYVIASGGYDAVPHDGLRFFPLYPMLAKVLAWPIGGHVGFTLVLVTNTFAFACLALLRRLVVEETGDDDLGRRAMWLLALFPAAGAFVLAYSESLMLAASLGAFLAMRRGRWWLTAALGFACGLTRPVGLLLIMPIAIEAVRSRRGDDWPSRIAAFVSPAVGASVYLFWVGGAYGDWLEPIRIQSRLRRGFQDPLTRLYDGVHLAVTKSQLDLPNVLFALGFVALAVVAVRTQRASWWSYAVLTLVVALSAHNIDSIGRYGLVAFPFVVALARLGEDERVHWATVGLSAAGLGVLTLVATLGAYTP